MKTNTDKKKAKAKTKAKQETVQDRFSKSEFTHNGINYQLWRDYNTENMDGFTRKIFYSWGNDLYTYYLGKDADNWCVTQFLSPSASDRTERQWLDACWNSVMVSYYKNRV